MSQGQMPLEFQEFPGKWKVLPFNKAILDKTGGSPKVKKGDYKKTGLLPVIDQGQTKIGGYVDDSSLLCNTQLPCILFGDHTKIFKFLDSPFVLGADGVKVLSPINGLDAKFAYYYLKQLRLPEDAGYSRHFKFLKRSYVPVPTLEEQKRIVTILDKENAIRRKREKSIKMADEFLRSLFLDMFGDPVTNPKGWDVASIDEIGDIQGGVQVTRKRENHPIKVPYLRVANVFRDKLDLREIKNIKVTETELNRVRLVKGDILIVEGHGNRNEIGRSSVWDGSIDPIVHQNHLIRVRPNSKIVNSIYISTYLNSAGGRRQLFNFGKTTSGLNTISTNNVKNTKILVPSIKIQNKYLERCNKVSLLKKKLSIYAENDDNLFKSLTQLSFRGDL